MDNLFAFNTWFVNTLYLCKKGFIVEQKDIIAKKKTIAKTNITELVVVLLLLDYNN